jgi:hypothetical protein
MGCCSANPLRVCSAVRHFLRFISRLGMSSDGVERFSLWAGLCTDLPLQTMLRLYCRQESRQ